MWLASPKSKTNCPPPLSLLFFVSNNPLLLIRYVTCESELLDVMAAGAMNRATAATGMNEGSSRSHSVFMVTVSQRNLENNSLRSGKLFLVWWCCFFQKRVNDFFMIFLLLSGGPCWFRDGSKNSSYWAAAGRSENHQ